MAIMKRVTDDKPERTRENVPDEVIEKALDIAANYGECPYCGLEQWHTVVPGHNSSHTCFDCGESVAVVG